MGGNWSISGMTSPSWSSTSASSSHQLDIRHRVLRSARGGVRVRRSMYSIAAEIDEPVVNRIRRSHTVYNDNNIITHDLYTILLFIIILSFYTHIHKQSVGRAYWSVAAWVGGGESPSRTTGFGGELFALRSSRSSSVTYRCHGNVRRRRVTCY